MNTLTIKTTEGENGNFEVDSYTSLEGTDLEVYVNEMIAIHIQEWLGYDATRKTKGIRKRLNQSSRRRDKKDA